MTRAFYVRQPQQLSFPRLQEQECLAHLCPGFQVFFSDLLYLVQSRDEFTLPPAIIHEVGRNPKEVALALSVVHLRQLGRKKTAVALLQEVVHDVAITRDPQQVSPQRARRPVIEGAKCRLVHAGLFFSVFSDFADRRSTRLARWQDCPIWQPNTHPG